MAIQDAYLESAIKGSVEQYERHSKSRNLKHLTLANVGRIVKLAKQDKKFQNQLKDTLTKRDYYVSRLNKSLNSLVEKYGVDANQETSLDAATLDSRWICTRYHAHKFLETMSPETTLRISAVIKDHIKFQQSYEQIIREIIKNPNYNDEQVKKKLGELYEEMETRQVKMHDASVQLLREMNIPFFALAEGWAYPGADEDKVYLLEVLMSKFGSSGD